jgi:hypothetical protein
VRKNLLLLGIILLLTSCGPDFNTKTISHLERYKASQTILNKNLDYIKKAVNFQEYDSVKKTSNSTIINSNKYFFENTILTKHNNELKQIVALWNDKLIANDVVSGTITLKNDGAIVFCTEFDNGLFYRVGHFIVYDPKEDNGGLGKKNNEILKEKTLESHWKYIIEKRYYND